jgi:hypothetical protein
VATRVADPLHGEQFIGQVLPLGLLSPFLDALVQVDEMRSLVSRGMPWSVKKCSTAQRIELAQALLSYQNAAKARSSSCPTCWEHPLGTLKKRGAGETNSGTYSVS